MLTPDEIRIAAWLRRIADNYDERAETTWRGFFGHDRVKAKLLRAIATAIEEGKHR